MDGGAIQGNGLARTLNAHRGAPVKAARSRGDVAAGKSRSLHGHQRVLAVGGTVLYSQ